MKKFSILVLGFLFLIGAGCGTLSSNRSVTADWKVHQSNYFKGLAFKMPAGYIVEDGTASKLVTIKKENGDVPRLEIFHMKDFGDRPWGVEGTETQDDLDGYVPKEQLVVQGFDVWFYYSEKDIAAKTELHTLANSITYNLTNTTSQKSFTLHGFTMTVPDKYSVGKIKGSKVWIKTDDKKYDVKLVLEITPMTTVEFKKATAGLTPDAVLKNGSVYKEGCSGFGCYNMMVGEKAFAVQSTIESNEKAPLNLDGVWSPSTIATSQDLLSILKTVEVK
jgi:hypothetical protein